MALLLWRVACGYNLCEGLAQMKLYTFTEVIPKLLKGQVVRRYFKRMDSARYYYFMAERYGTDWLYCYQPNKEDIVQFRDDIVLMAEDLRDRAWYVEKDKEVLSAINKQKKINE